MTQLNREPDFLFTLRVCVFASEPLVVVNAFEGRDAGRGRMGDRHNRIDVEVRQGGRVVFPRGALYCGLPTFKSIDGPDARELVLLLVAMTPPCFGHCDTDADYFADYTSEQLAWAERHGDGVSYAASRYAPKEKA